MGLPVIENVNNVCWITFDRPEVANALRIEDVSCVEESVRGIGDAIRAIVFTGSGNRNFSAGMHLDTFRQSTPLSARSAILCVANMLRAVRLCPVPTVAVLNGTCLGAAFELALSCDIRIAHPGVRVGLPEIKLGIPSVADAALLPAFVGIAKAREVILTGDSYTIEELGPGVANSVIPQSELRTELDRLLAVLMAPNREVIAAQKELFEVWLNHGIDASVVASVDIFSELFIDSTANDAIETYVHGRRG